MEYKNNHLGIVIEILKEILDNLPKPKNDLNAAIYQSARKSMGEYAFNLTQYARLFTKTEVNKIKLSELCTLLNTLKNNRYFKIQPEQEQRIREHEDYQGLLQALDKKIDELTPGKDINSLIQQLGNIGESIIDDSTVDRLYEIIDKYEISSEKSIIIFKELMKYINMVSQKQIVNTPHVLPKLTEEQLTELFNKYGYDFKKVPQDFKERFYIKGNLENMEELFKCLPSYGIIFSETNKATLYILLRSNKEILENISKLAEEYNFEIKDIVSNVTGAFFEKERELDTRRIPSQEATSETKFKGSFEDFYKIIKMVEGLGYDVGKTIETNSTLFTSTSKRIAFNIQLLKEYGFMDNGNLSETPFKLSGLKSTSMQTIIDVFIELDELEYLSKNSSRLILQPNDLFIQKIYTAKRVKNISNEELKKLRRTKNGDKFVFVGETIKAIEVNTAAMTNYVFDKETDEAIKIKLNEILRESIPTIENHSDLEKLEQYRRDSRTYIFDQVIISSRKVQTVYPILLREYQNLDKKKLLLFAVTYNTMMNSEEFENIKSKIVAKEISL